MSITQVDPGGTAPLLWDWAMQGGDELPDVHIKDSLLNDVTAPVCASDGSGHVFAVWAVPSLQAEGIYSAYLSGSIGGQATVSDSIRIYVGQGVAPASTFVSYVSVDEFKDQVFSDYASTASDAALARALAAVSASIDRECGRTFTKTELQPLVVDTRTHSYVRSNGCAVLTLPDFAETSNVSVSVGTYGSWTPIQGVDFGFETWSGSPGTLSPWVNIIRFGVPWDTYIPLVQVTAQWGWPSVPPQVVQAVMLQANRIFSRKGSPEGAAGPAEWGLTVVPRIDPDVRALLVGLKRTGIA